MLCHIKDGTLDIESTDYTLDGAGFEVEFEDGYCATYTANQIAAEIYAACNTKGYHTLIMKKILIIAIILMYPSRKTISIIMIKIGEFKNRRLLLVRIY